MVPLITKHMRNVLVEKEVEFHMYLDAFGFLFVKEKLFFKSIELDIDY